MTYPEIFDAVVTRLKAFAQEHYNEGWDVVVECWDRADFIETLTNVVTTETLTNEDELYRVALEDIQQFVTLYKEQIGNTRFE